jgi:HAD-hyrolase-like
VRRILNCILLADGEDSPCCQVVVDKSGCCGFGYTSSCGDQLQCCPMLPAIFRLHLAHTAVCSCDVLHDTHHRNQLVRAAGSITARYHVGDTPMDLQAADGAGAQGIGVTTGIYSRKELAASSPGAARLILMTLV